MSQIPRTDSPVTHSDIGVSSTLLSLSIFSGSIPIYRHENTTINTINEKKSFETLTDTTCLNGE